MKININKSFPYVLILSLIASAMEIDLSLPSFPDIARFFSVSEEMIERTISINFLGFCLSSLWYGPLADRFGRRPIMLIGNAIFFIGSLGCALATSIEMVLLFRFIQGLGAAASFVIVFTMLSDVYQGNDVTKWMGRLNAILTTTIAAAPIFGGVLNAYFGWRGCYSVVAIWSTLSFLFIFFFLPETKKTQDVKLKDIFQNYVTLLKSKRFLQSALVPTLLAAAYFAFISVMPFFYRDVKGISLKSFSIHQAIIIASFSFMSYFAHRISNVFGEKKSALFGLLIPILATLSIFCITWLTPNFPVWQVTLFMCIFALSCAVGYAVVFSASLGVFPDKNGPASSLIMTIRTFVCAGIIQLVGFLYNKTLQNTFLIISICTLLSFVLALNFYKTKVVSKEVQE